MRPHPARRWVLWGLWLALIGFAAWQADLPGLLKPAPKPIRGSVVRAPGSKAAGVAASVDALPGIAPVEYLPFAPGTARTANAAVPFAKVPNPAGRPFILKGSDDDRERALTCLASAAFYEAGDDPLGQRAVVQVVLNRVRHPAFPHNVCGVVFEGAERRTGCQFTFTCDGALARVPDPRAWERARAIANLALSGAVFGPVGNATHYHADYVVPNWAPEMDKVAQVHLHLFYLWRGGWGAPPAFRAPYAAAEQIDPRIVKLSRVAPKIADEGAALLLGSTGTAPSTDVTRDPHVPTAPIADASGNSVRLFDPVSNQYIVQLNAGAFPGSYALFAYTLCRDKTPCKVAGWRVPANLPRSVPLKGTWQTGLSFLYDKRGSGNQTSRWNCTETPRDNPEQCLSPP